MLPFLDWSDYNFKNVNSVATSQFSGSSFCYTPEVFFGFSGFLLPHEKQWVGYQSPFWITFSFLIRELCLLLFRTSFARHVWKSGSLELGSNHISGLNWITSGSKWRCPAEQTYLLVQFSLMVREFAKINQVHSWNAVKLGIFRVKSPRIWKLGTNIWNASH